MTAPVCSVMAKEHVAVEFVAAIMVGLDKTVVVVRVYRIVRLVTIQYATETESVTATNVLAQKIQSTVKVGQKTKCSGNFQKKHVVASWRYPVATRKSKIVI